MKSKYEHWKSKYNFENCGVGRREHGKFLMSYITGEKDGFVLNLNGEWGSGKTEFLKRIYTGLSENYPVIYIDAWESDFTNDPLLVVASELINQLKMMFEISGADLDKVKDYLGKFAKGTLVASAGFLSKKFIDDASVGSDFVKAFMEADSKEYLETLEKGYSGQVKALEGLRKELENLADSLKSQYKKNLPVVVLVDELDRCRPNYSIEMLEVIKHFFATRNFVFVIATDTTQLQRSIKAVYGAEFSSKQYLKRFFNREARLAPPDLNTFIKQYDFDIPQNIIIYPVWSNLTKTEVIKKCLVWSARAFGMELRDIDQAVFKLQACLRVIIDRGNAKQIVNVFSLIMAILEFDESYQTYIDRKDNKPLAERKSIDFVVSDPSSDTKTMFSQLYHLNMVHSVNYTVAADFPPGAKQQITGFDNNSLRLNRKKASRMLLDAEKSILDAYGRVAEGDKMWLWIDYKDLVSLAYTIE
jgi:hypothetical protein